MKNKLFVLTYVIIAFVSCTKESKIELSSPNENVKIVLENEDGNLRYKLIKNENEVILNSSISIFPGIKVDILDLKSIFFSLKLVAAESR